MAGSFFLFFFGVNTREYAGYVIFFLRQGVVLQEVKYLLNELLI